MSRAPRVAIAVALISLASASPGGAVVNGKIAFERGAHIYLMNPDGSNKTNVTPEDGLYGQAEFSPNGQSLAYVSTPPGIATGDGGQDDVWVADANGANPRQVTQLGVQIESLHWSADGTRLLFVAERDADENFAEIYSINLDGTGLALVAPNAPRFDVGTGFTTAAGKVVFASLVDAASGYEIWSVNLDGTGLTRLTNAPGDDRNPVISPDATRIAWSSDRDNPPGVFSLATEMYEMNADGTNQRRITTSPRADVPVAFSPDNTLLGFNYNLYASLMPADGGATTTIVSTDGAFRPFSDWSPDAQRIVISEIIPIPGEDDDEFILRSVDRQGQQQVDLTNRTDSAVYQDWQPAETAPTDPPMTLEAIAKAPKQKARRARATVECSNECRLKLKATGTAGAKRFVSKDREHLYGNEPTDLFLLKSDVAREIRGKRGEVAVKIRVIDGVGGAPRTTVTSKLKP